MKTTCRRSNVMMQHLFPSWKSGGRSKPGQFWGKWASMEQSKKSRFFMFFSLVLCAIIVASPISSISPRELYLPEVAPPWMWIPHTWSLLGTLELPVWFTLKNTNKIGFYLLSGHPPIEVWMLKLALWYSASVKSRGEVSVWEWLRCQENRGNYWDPENEAMRAVVVSDPHAGLSCCWKEQITSEWHTKWTDHWHSLRDLVDLAFFASLSNR